MRHGDLSELLYGSLEAQGLLNQIEPCANCGHLQQDHDGRDRCGCGCQLFEYRPETEGRTNA